MFPSTVIRRSRRNGAHLANFVDLHHRNPFFLPSESTMITSFDPLPNSARDHLLPFLLPNPRLPCLAKAYGEPPSLRASHLPSPPQLSKCLTISLLVDLVPLLPSTDSLPAFVENKPSLPSTANARTHSLTATSEIQRTIDFQFRIQRSVNDLAPTRASLHLRVLSRPGISGPER